MKQMETSGTPATTENKSTEQVNAQIQTADGEVVQQEAANDVAALLTRVGDMLPTKKVKYVTKYSEAKKAGLKVVFFNFNREVYSSQLNALWKSAKDKKVFTEGCYVVPLRPILEKFPDIEVYDLEGNQVTLDSPDVDMCLAIYDGQHRITVCELHRDIDVWLDFNDFDGTNPLEKIKQMNSFSKNWSGTDLRGSNVHAGISTNQLYAEARKLQDLYGITPKLSEYILTFKREATTKKDLVLGQDTTIYVAENGSRGTGIFNAAMMNFQGSKELKKIEFTDAVVHTYNSISDKEKPGFARNMKLFLGTLKDCGEIRKLISDKDFGKLKTVVSKGYKAFCGAGHTEEALAQMEADVDKNIDAYVKALQTTNQDKASKKPLKSGRVHEVIRHNRDAETLVIAEKLAKAKAKAEKSTKKAREDQALVDNLKSTGRDGA